MTKELVSAPLRKLLKYTHLGPEDTKLWNRFIDGNPPRNAAAAYDVRLGTIPSIKADLPENIKTMAAAIYPKRADAVLLCPSETLVFEIRPYAGLSAIGNAVSYAQLFRRDYPHYPNITPVLLTDRGQCDVPWLCSLFRITLIELDSM